MKKILVIGGSKGIGKAIVASLIEKNNITNLSRTPPSLAHENLTHYNCDILTDELPQLDAVDALIYCPGSINLKPISRLKLEDFRADFEKGGSSKRKYENLLQRSKITDHKHAGEKRAKRNPHDEAAHEKSWTAAMPREREQHWQKLKNAHVWQKKT